MQQDELGRRLLAADTQALPQQRLTTHMAGSAACVQLQKRPSNSKLVECDCDAVHHSAHCLAGDYQ
jgi:hypothetical protein